MSSVTLSCKVKVRPSKNLPHRIAVIGDGLCAWSATAAETKTTTANNIEQHLFIFQYLISKLNYPPVVPPWTREDFRGAAEGMAKTTLRAVVGDLALDDVLSRREHMNDVLREKLDEVTSRWGVKVTAVEVREIQPPRDIQDAMSRQMSAERNRRAVVLEADGTRAAAIAVAEGEKAAAILSAEGLRQATILNAEGARQALILQAEGLAAALSQIDASASNIAANTMSLQYLDAFKTLSRSESSKWIVPLEFTSLLKPFVGAPPAAE